MNRLLIALTAAAIAVSGCKGEEKKDEGKQPEQKVEKKKAPPAPEAPKGVEGAVAPGEDPAAAEPAPTDPGVEPAATDPAPADPDGVPAAAEPALAPPPADPSKPVVVLETNLGIIKIELTPEQTPITVQNFLQYVNDGFYTGTIFHRVVPGFVIQGGGFTEDFAQKETRDPIQNEAAQGMKNVRGTISMARTRARESGTSQFFISLKDNPMLDYRGEHPTGWGYAAFGQVIEGMDVVHGITRRDPQMRPNFEGDMIESITVSEK